MTKKNVPKRLWDFGLVYKSEILSWMARGNERQTGYKEPLASANGLILNSMT
jgi:hypothetical protein